MSASESEAEDLAKVLAQAFDGKFVSFTAFEEDEGWLIFVLSQEGPLELKKLLPNGWIQSEWMDAEHRGVRCIVAKQS